MSSNDKPETVTVYVSIGNSDDKLTQADWSSFVADLQTIMLKHAERVFGVWFSAPDAAYQNACIAVGVRSTRLEDFRQAVTRLRTRYRQESAAWAEVPRTEFI